MTLEYAERQLRYYSAKVAELCQTSDASDTKEREEGKEKFPPHPLIEKGKKAEKATTGMATPYSLADANRQADGGLAAIFPTDEKALITFLATKPEQAVFLAWCKAVHIDNVQWATERYEDVEAGGWVNDDNHLITNWPKYFKAAYRAEQGKALSRMKARRSFQGAYKALPEDVRKMFDAFWSDYPNRRRVEKDKCAEKFYGILHESGDSVSMFNRIMEGLAKWKESLDWKKLDGEYVMMPYRWLLNENWTINPGKGRETTYSRRGISQTANCHSERAGEGW